MEMLVFMIFVLKRNFYKCCVIYQHSFVTSYLCLLYDFVIYVIICVRSKVLANTFLLLLCGLCVIVWYDLSQDAAA